MSAALLEVKNLQAYFIGFQGSRVVKAVDDISFSLKEGETLGIVGESGCGKTTTCHALFNLLPPGGQLMGGSIQFDGTEITSKSQKEMQKIRGKEMAMILQDRLFLVLDLVLVPSTTSTSNRRLLVLVSLARSRTMHHRRWNGM